MVYSLGPSVVAVTETWLSDSYFNGEILPAGYTVFRKDRGTRGGGVLLVVDHSLSVSLPPSPSTLEVLTIRLDLSKPVLVCAMYVSPSPETAYFNVLLFYLGTLFSSDGSVFVAGDFNCPDIDWMTLCGTSPVSSALWDFMFDLNISQIIESPTHVKSNVLDLVLTNSAELLDSVIVFPDKFQCSDHFS